MTFESLAVCIFTPAINIFWQDGHLKLYGFYIRILLRHSFGNPYVGVKGIEQSHLNVSHWSRTKCWEVQVSF